MICRWLFLIIVMEPLPEYESSDEEEIKATKGI